MKRFNRKGFTLAELLIVVAIIAVLAAIAIPIFTAQLAKARTAADEANIRSGYAVVSAKVLDNADTADGTKWGLNSDGTVTEGSATLTPGSFKAAGSGKDVEIAGQKVTWTAGSTIFYSFSKTGNLISINK